MTDGLARERRQRRQRWTLFAVLFVAGLAVGFTYSQFEEGGTGIADGTIPGWLAIVLSAVTLIAVGGGSWWMQRRMDEVERHHNYAAGAMGVGVYFLLYPVWYFLWRGELVPEPSHVALFGVLYLTVMTTYFVRKWRAGGFSGE